MPPAAKKSIVKKKKPVKRLPLSGGELEFKLQPWSSAIANNNCYAYAVGDFNSYNDRRINKSLPGERAGLDRTHSYTHCGGNLGRRVIADNPGKVYLAKSAQRCKPNFYKVMMFVASKNKYGNSNGDFHFYRQHGIVNYTVKPGDSYTRISKFFGIPLDRVKKSNKTDKLTPGMTLRFKANGFSHKRGWGTGPLLVDAKGKAIVDPRKSNNRYGYEYDKHCCSFCVKNKGIEVGRTYPNVTKK